MVIGYSDVSYLLRETVLMVASIKSKLKYTLQKTLLILSSGIFALAASMGTVHAAGSATLSLTPNSGTYALNDFITYTVKEDSGTQGIASVQVNLRYNPAALQLVSLDGGASDFPLAGTDVLGSGSINIPRAAPPQNGQLITGSHEVVKVTFKVIGYAASTAITFDPTSIISSDGYNNFWNQNPAGATLNIPAPPPPPTTSGTGSGGSGTTTNSGGTTVKSPAVTKTAPAVTPAPGSSVVAAPPTGAPAEVPEVLKPVTHFVAIKVVGGDGKAVKGAKVTLSNQTETTSSNGVASFTGVVEGEQEVTITYSGKKLTRSVTVKSADPKGSNLQQFEVKLASGKSNSSNKGVIYAVMAVVLIVLFIVVMPRRRRFKPAGGDAFAPADAIIVGDMSKNKPNPAAPHTVHSPQQSPATPAPAPTIAPPPQAPVDNPLPSTKAAPPGQVVPPTQGQDNGNNINKE